MLDVANLTVRYGVQTVLDHASFAVQQGDWLMIAGPNGAGKSTLLNAVAQGIPYTGTVRLNGRDVAHIKPKERARWLGTLSQSHHVGYAFTVEEIVRLGRYAHTGALSAHTQGDEQAVQDALRFTGMNAYRNHSVLTLSGGELQRTFLAQLFAQDPHLLLLDEPTNHLDLVYQKQVFGLIHEWLQTPGRAAVSVVHDLSLALRYGTRALLMDRGRIGADGIVTQALSQENLARVYGMDVVSWMQEMLSQWTAKTWIPKG